MDYIIKFDNREKDLIKILEDKGYNVTLENLDLGDIQFVDLTTKEIIIIIERKTYADLSASIKDGRYKEQKERMIHSIKKSIRKIVLIEGENTSTFKLPINTLTGVIINTILRDNIHIKIALLHLDLDTYEPTKYALDKFSKMIIKGGIILIDDYSTVYGATKAIDEFLKKNKKLKIQKFTFYKKPSFIINE